MEQRRVARQIAQGLAEALDSQLDQLLGIAAVGGGSPLLAEALSGIIQPDDAQWANARGYAAVMESVWHPDTGRFAGTAQR